MESTTGPYTDLRLETLGWHEVSKVQHYWLDTGTLSQHLQAPDTAP